MTKPELVETLNRKIKSCRAEVPNRDQWSILNKGRVDAYEDVLNLLNNGRSK